MIGGETLTQRTRAKDRLLMVIKRTTLWGCGKSRRVHGGAQHESRLRVSRGGANRLHRECPDRREPTVSSTPGIQGKSASISAASFSRDRDEDCETASIIMRFSFIFNRTWMRTLCSSSVIPCMISSLTDCPK